MINEAVISMGSNINARQNIEKAFSLLQYQFQLIKKAGPVETSPIGIKDQPHFLNAVALVATSLAMNEVVAKLKGMEDDMGRDRSRPKFGPREIDLDVIIWNQNVVDEDYYERDFLGQLVKGLKQ